MKKRLIITVAIFFVGIFTAHSANDSLLVIRGYNVQTLTLQPDFDGTPTAVLISKKCSDHSKYAVLYVHGYNDYFFQEHLADWYLARGFNFYALELRRYGHALQQGQLRYDVRHIEDYYEELDMAIDSIRHAHGNTFILLNGHSMGGLITALYTNDRASEGIDALFLNSPFLELNAGWFTRRILAPVFVMLGRIAPRTTLPIACSTYYGESLHCAYRGEWLFDPSLKLMCNRPRAGWFRAIRRAHRKIRRELHIPCPILVMHSDKTGNEGAWNEEIHTTDIVLNVDDIARLAPTLGPNVKMSVIPQAKHDVFLSYPEIRAQAFSKLGIWIDANIHP